MNTNEKYRAWIERSRPLNVSADFAGDVMHRVCQQAERQQTRWNWPGLLEFFQRNVSFQYAALAVAATAGLSRLWLIFFAILQP